jgi:hypothetical protein
MTDDKYGMFFAVDKHNEDGVDLEKFAELIVRECARIAAMFSIDKNDIHPDIKWDKMNEASKMVAHTTCQQVAIKIEEHFGVEEWYTI